MNFVWPLDVKGKKVPKVACLKSTLAIGTAMVRILDKKEMVDIWEPKVDAYRAKRGADVTVGKLVTAM